MTKKHILILFLFAGLMLATVVGVYVYQSNRAPSQAEIIALLTDFTQKIAAGDTEGARQLMTEDSRILLRDPGTALGQTVYRELKLKSVDNLFAEGDGNYIADVVFTTPDTLKIMTKAGMLFAERVTEEGPTEDPDALMASIYDGILSRDDLPMLDQFCVVRMAVQDGRLLIRGDEALQAAVEGGQAVSSGVLEKLGE